MKKIKIISVIAAFAAMTVLVWTHQTKEEIFPHEKTTVVLGGRAFTAYISDTDELRNKGLGGFEGLAEDEAMLFVFETAGLWSFWMKDMLFSIDMLWLDEDMRAVHLEKGVSPRTFPRSFAPDEPARYVVELPAGTLDELGVQEGDSASLR